MNYFKKSLLGVWFCLPVITGLANGFHLGVMGGSAWLTSHEPRDFKTTPEILIHTHKGSVQSRASFLFGMYAGYEWGLPGQLKFQLGEKYFHADSEEHTGYVQESVGYHNFNYEFDSISDVLLVDTRLSYQPSWLGDFAPFVGFLFGVSFNQVKNFQAVNTDPSHTLGLYFDDGSETSFAYGVALGIKTEFAFPINIGVEYDYLSLGRAQFGTGYIMADGPKKAYVSPFNMRQALQAAIISIDYKF